jgi:hypothetical protein
MAEPRCESTQMLKFPRPGGLTSVRVGAQLFVSRHHQLDEILEYLPEPNLGDFAFDRD